MITDILLLIGVVIVGILASKWTIYKEERERKWKAYQKRRMSGHEN